MLPIKIGYHTYEYEPTLNGGYYDAERGWHHYRSTGKYVWNIDEHGKKFFNKI